MSDQPTILKYYDGTNNDYKANTGWVVRYRGQFMDMSGVTWLVEIIDSNTSASHGFSFPSSQPKSIALGEEGFSISMDGKADKFEVGPIATTCAIDMVVDEQDHLDLVTQMGASDDYRFGLAVYHFASGDSDDGEVSSVSDTVHATPYWFGLISNDQAEWKPMESPWYLHLEAICGLALLNDIPYVNQANNTPHNGLNHFARHIRRCMDQIPTSSLWGYTTNDTGLTTAQTSDLVPPFLVAQNWIVNKDMLSSGSLTKCVLRHTRVESNSFYEIQEDEDIFGGIAVRSDSPTCADVLKEICLVLNLRMVQWGGSWWMHNPMAFDETAKWSIYPRSMDVADTDPTPETWTHSDTNQTVRIYENLFSYLDESSSQIKDSFLYPAGSVRSVHKKGGASDVAGSSSTSLMMAAENYNEEPNTNPFIESTVVQATEAVFAGESTVSISGQFVLRELGYEYYTAFNPGQENIDFDYIGMVALVHLTIKVGDYYLKRDLVQAGSSDEIDIDRPFPSSTLAFRKWTQDGNVEWTTTPSTYTFQAPFEGCDEAPAIAVIGEGDDEEEVLGGLHLELHDDGDKFRYYEGIFGVGTQHTAVAADIAWALPTLPSHATGHVGVEVSGEVNYWHRSSGNKLPYGWDDDENEYYNLRFHHPAKIDNFTIFSGALQEEGDQIFVASQDSSYTTLLTTTSILGDTYTEGHNGRLFVDQAGVDANKIKTEGKWVEYNNLTGDGSYIHRLLANRNLNLRRNTLRARKCTITNSLLLNELDSNGNIIHRQNKIFRSLRVPQANAGDAEQTNYTPLICPSFTVKEVDQHDQTERDFYIMTMTFTGRYQLYDFQLTLCDIDASLPDEEVDDGPTRDPSNGNPTKPIGFDGGPGLSQNKGDTARRARRGNLAHEALPAVKTDVVQSKAVTDLVTLNGTKTAISGIVLEDDTIRADKIQTNQAKTFATTAQLNSIASNSLSVTSLTDSVSDIEDKTDLIQITEQHNLDNTKDTVGHIQIDGSNGITGFTVKPGSTPMTADEVSTSGTTNKFATQAQLNKVDYLTVTAATSLDSIRTRTNFIQATQQGITGFTVPSGGKPLDADQIDDDSTDSKFTDSDGVQALGHLTSDSTGITAIQVSSSVDIDANDVGVFFGGSAGDTANRSGVSNKRVVLIGSDGGMEELAAGAKGEFLQSGGTTQDPSFSGVPMVIGALSGRVTTRYSSNFYYGSSSYGWNYPLWSNITFNNQTGNPYARNISDDYAHCGIVLAKNASTIKVNGTVRNDSSTSDIEVFLGVTDSPDGSSSNMVLTEIASETVSVSTQDRHYDFELSSTTAVTKGQLLFLAFARTTGASNTTVYLNFSATIIANP